MHPPEDRVVEVAKQLVAISVQAAQAYNQAQAALQLDVVLSQDRLSTTAGTQASLQTLEQLSALKKAHKAAFQKFVLGATSALVDTMSGMPEALHLEQRSSLVTTVNWHLSAQSDFYAGRERWIQAANAICHLVEARRATSHFGEQGIVFADERDADTLDAHLQVIEDVHQQEVVRLKERLSRMAQSASILGIRPLA